MRLPIEFISARINDPATSQANKDAFVKKRSQRDEILLTYHRLNSYDYPQFAEGIIDEEAGMNTFRDGVSYFDLRICYWKRCSELRKMGLIETTGITRISSAGQQQQVCCITIQGVNYVNKLLYG
jgi:hypothetical protein